MNAHRTTTRCHARAHTVAGSRVAF